MNIYRVLMPAVLCGLLGCQQRDAEPVEVPPATPAREQVLTEPAIAPEPVALPAISPEAVQDAATSAQEQPPADPDHPPPSGK